jgi:hypothetical protein
VHPKISAAIGALLDQLSALGVEFGGTAYCEDSFGDFCVGCTLGGKQFRLFRDRGQYMIDGEMDELKRQGLWRTFDSVEEYSAAVVKYAKPVA